MKIEKKDHKYNIRAKIDDALYASIHFKYRSGGGGCQVEDVIQVCIERLEELNGNKYAIKYLKTARRWLEYEKSKI